MAPRAAVFTSYRARFIGTGSRSVDSQGREHGYGRHAVNLMLGVLFGGQFVRLCSLHVAPALCVKVDRVVKALSNALLPPPLCTEEKEAFVMPLRPSSRLPALVPAEGMESSRAERSHHVLGQIRWMIVKQSTRTATKPPGLPWGLHEGIMLTNASFPHLHGERGGAFGWAS